MWEGQKTDLRASPAGIARCTACGSKGATHRRSRSLDVSGPHRMMSGTNAIGAWWWQADTADA
jgi:hypothetical protein